MIGSITAGIVALQRYNRNRYDEMGRLDGSSLNTRRGWGTAEGTETPALTKLQMALFIEHREGRRDMLSTLKVLSQSADVNTRGGLAALVDEVINTSQKAPGSFDQFYAESSTRCSQ